MQAMLGQEPPIHRRSTTAVRRPDRAISQARSLPPAPLPRTKISNCSGWDMSVLLVGVRCWIDLPHFRLAATVYGRPHARSLTREGLLAVLGGAGPAPMTMPPGGCNF